MSELWSGQFPVLADTSAWLKVSRAPETVREHWARALKDRAVMVFPVVTLELLHNETDVVAVNTREYELSQLPQLPLTPTMADDAITAVLDLAAMSDGYHRVRAADALIAAAAARTRCVVLHHDAHYDRLAQVLDFECYAVMPPPARA